MEVSWVIGVPPVIIHLNRIFLCKLSIFGGTTIYGNPPSIINWIPLWIPRSWITCLSPVTIRGSTIPPLIINQPGGHWSPHGLVTSVVPDAAAPRSAQAAVGQLVQLLVCCVKKMLVVWVFYICIYLCMYLFSDWISYLFMFICVFIFVFISICILISYYLHICIYGGS